MDQLDSSIYSSLKNLKKSSSMEALNSEMPFNHKDRGRRIVKSFLNKLRLKKYASATISRPDPVYKVAYLGNVVTGFAKGAGCVEKPLATLWRNYTHSSRPDVRMQLSVSNGGLKATTKDHGLTEYWAHRLTTCAAPSEFPRLFCWIYRHEGRKLRHELRCHAVLCSSPNVAKQLEAELKQALKIALVEFKKDKISRQNARLSLVNSVYDNPTIPRRKILLSTGSHNYRPPLERSKSAPKLTIIEESALEEEEEIFDKSMPNVYKKILRHYDSTSALLDKRKIHVRKLQEKYKPSESIVPVVEICDEYENDRICKVTFNSDVTTYTLEQKTDMILDELVQNSMKNDLLESCERAWYTALGDKPDLIPPDSDEGSLSSGCESASTVNSDDSEPPVFPTIQESSQMEEKEEEGSNRTEKKRTDLDFKLGGSVLSRVCSLEKLTNPDIIKYRGFNNNLYSGSILNEEVSLIPVGESQADFSSLKVFKRRCNSEPTGRESVCNLEETGHNIEEDTGSACSDESGYEEEEMASSIGNIILV